MLRTLALSAALVASLANAASAQLRGVVRDTAGHPVAGATVEAWAGLRRVGSTLSAATGEFSLNHVQAGAGTGLVVRRIGFRRLAVGIPQGDGVLQLRLVPETMMLEGITATTAVRACPNRDDPAARAAWATASAKYPVFSDTVVFHSLAALRDADVTRDEIEFVGQDGGVRGWSAAGTRAWDLWRRQIRAGGYAVRIQRGFGTRYALWQYAPLEMVFSQHFVDPLFGELHSFSIAAAGSGQTTIRFCPHERGSRGRPELEGTLTLSSDGVLLRASWRYRTPNPAEDAGGDVDFLPLQATAQSLLLPERSRFWRKTTGGRYHVETAAYEEWRLFPGSDAPPVPTEVSAPAPTR